MKKLLALGATVLATAGFAFWAPNHQDMNVQVIKQGTPWGIDIKRGGQPITTFDEYLHRVLYVSAEPPKSGDVERAARDSTNQCVKGREDLVMGVPFEAGGPDTVIGNDKPTDKPRLGLPLYCWVVKGGFWEDGFESIADGTKWGGRRAVNHFHDPLAAGGGGYTGLLNENALESTAVLNLAPRHLGDRVGDERTVRRRRRQERLGLPHHRNRPASGLQRN